MLNEGLLTELTAKEKDVVGCLVIGWSDRRIARHLGIRPQTVKNRLCCIRQKLELQSRTQVVVYALTGYKPNAAASEAQ